MGSARRAEEQAHDQITERDHDRNADEHDPITIVMIVIVHRSSPHFRKNPKWVDSLERVNRFTSWNVLPQFYHTSNDLSTPAQLACKVDQSGVNVVMSQCLLDRFKTFLAEQIHGEDLPGRMAADIVLDAQGS